MEDKFYSKFYKDKKVQKKNGNSGNSSKVSKKTDNNTSRNKTGNMDSEAKTIITDKKAKDNQNNKEIRAHKSSKKTENRTQKNTFEIIGQLFDEQKIPAESKNVLENFDTIVQNVRPLNSKQLQQLPQNIRDLSHQLTDNRSVRRLGYMNENIQLSAYVRYFTWWNLVRLSRLFSNLPEKAFPSEDSVCIDLGSGPLTVVIALWLARPELRKLNLTWYCLDVSQKTMALGEDLYLSIAAKIPGNTWKIIRVNGAFGENLKQKADFITCANMFNELDQASDMPPEFQTKKYFDQLIHYSNKENKKAKFLLIEPGVPKAARTLSLLRQRFVNENYSVLAPCPHAFDCPMNGFKAYTGSQNKWCNLAFNTESAPRKLQQLSEKSKLPKERAVLSFISAVFQEQTVESSPDQTATNDILVRIISDGFRLPSYKTGFYACSQFGLTLISKPQIPAENETIVSGALLKLKLKEKAPDSSSLFSKDEKSGAIKIEF